MNPISQGVPQLTVEELKARQPMKAAMALHPFYKSRIETTLKACEQDFDLSQ